MKRTISKLFMTGLGAITFLACQTAHNVKVDESRGELSLYSNDDQATAMPDPSKSRTFESLAGDLTESAKSKESTKASQIKSYLNLAQVSMIRGDLDRAEGAVRNVLRRDLKNRQAKIALADIFYRRGMYDMADTILVGLQAKKSKDSRILNLMALIALKRNHNGLAMAHFKEALRHNSSDVAVRMNLGVLYLEFRQLKEAAIQFERVLSVLPNHQDARLHLAVVWQYRGKKSQAKSVYESILSEKDRNPVAMYNYAVLLGEEKEYETAVSYLKDYLKVAKGKSARTDKAFALISDIRQKMAVDGKQISNEEIEALAINLDQKEKDARAVNQKMANDRLQKKMAKTTAKKSLAKAKKEKKKKKLVAVAAKKEPTKATKTAKVGKSKKKAHTMSAKPLIRKKKSSKKKVKRVEKKAAPEEIDDLERLLME